MRRVVRRDAIAEPWGSAAPYAAGDVWPARVDTMLVATARGAIRAHVRVGGIRDGVLFVPFHDGHWDAGSERDAECADPADGADRRDRAANELTRTTGDAVSRQPLFKTAAARLTPLGPGDGAVSAPTTTASRAAGTGVPPTTGGRAARVTEGDDPGAA